MGWDLMRVWAKEGLAEFRRWAELSLMRMAAAPS